MCLRCLCHPVSPSADARRGTAVGHGGHTRRHTACALTPAHATRPQPYERFRHSPTIARYRGFRDPVAPPTTSPLHVDDPRRAVQPDVHGPVTSRSPAVVSWTRGPLCMGLTGVRLARQSPAPTSDFCRRSAIRHLGRRGFSECHNTAQHPCFTQPGSRGSSDGAMVA